MDKKEYLESLLSKILPHDVVKEQGTGYVVDCLKSSFKVIKESNSYEETIKKLQRWVMIQIQQQQLLEVQQVFYMVLKIYLRNGLKN